MTEKSNKHLITQSMFDNLEYDKDMETSNTKLTAMTTNVTSPLAMLIFHTSDIDAATYHLAKSLDSMNSNSIRCVFVQESCAERFSAKLKSKLKSYTKEELQSLQLIESIEKANEIVSRLNAKTILPETLSEYVFPLVWDFPQEHFQIDGKPLPVVSLFTFRTTKEAIGMVKKESICKGATIWCENQAMSYEVIAETPLKDYYLNCFNVDWAPIQQYITKEQPFAVVEKSYHYETLQVAGKMKNIVFPYGTSFAN
ncbi:uncharacterized protein LOC129912673 [Episyrphus balteatus]|uniref:uncharacterized protein LOC129912673 n=1 Tax=Episyrphus balteatus TaxID=286459 RepID=UPI0024856153|nr:uncharacterized protein LOC129912673 [Episyrphus balteatus]